MHRAHVSSARNLSMFKIFPHKMSKTDRNVYSHRKIVINNTYRKIHFDKDIYKLFSFASDSYHSQIKFLIFVWILPRFIEFEGSCILTYSYTLCYYACKNVFFISAPWKLIWDNMLVSLLIHDNKMPHTLGVIFS